MNKINLNKTKLKVALVASMAGLFVPAQTYAVDLVASSEIPSIGFVDLDLAAGTNFDTWSLSGDSQFFLLQDVNANLTGENTHTVMSIFGANGADLNENSFIVDSAGDVNLANGSVFVDRSTGAVGIGTSTPTDDLSIVGSDPTIRLEDTDGTNWEINSTPLGAMFDITNDTAAVSMLKIKSDAPEDALVLHPNGIGMGTANPFFDLHIKSNDAKFFVQDINGATPSGVLMELSKFGIPAFRITNTKTNNSWDFSQRDDKRFAFSLAGTGAFEFTIDESGNTVTRGNSTAVAHISSSSREVKTDFAKINPKEVMNKIKTMEVSEWRYKNTASKGRHIGPMAEDFYSLFELGPDDKHVAATDMASIALIAAKELQKKSDIVSSETASLKYETMALKMENASLKERLASLEKLVTNLASGQDLLPETGNKVVLK